MAKRLLLLVLLGVGCDRWMGGERSGGPAESAPAPIEIHEGFLYGRVTTEDGTTYEGRLRFGVLEEAFWNHYFNAQKDRNPWAELAPPDRLVKRGEPTEIFGLELLLDKRPIELRRPFMARFGDIARIEARGRDLWVTMKSGTRFHLDRFAADDFADGVRVWDRQRGVTDLDEWSIRSIELLPAPHGPVVVGRLHGTVRTARGTFTGFIQWDRQASLGSDEIGEERLRFDAIRSIARRSADTALATLRDGREIVVSGGDRRGIYVDDPRYGRVLVDWDAFERIDFSDGGNGPAYGDFPPGRPLRGTVITRAGHRLAGRLVCDLDESETTETLDAPFQGVHYTIPFSLVASIDVPRARVTLHDGEELQLEPAGDLGAQNAGMLVFMAGRPRPEYVAWTEVANVDFDISPGSPRPAS